MADPNQLQVILSDIAILVRDGIKIVKIAANGGKVSQLIAPLRALSNDLKRQGALLMRAQFPQLAKVVANAAKLIEQGLIALRRAGEDDDFIAQALAPIAKALTNLNRSLTPKEGTSSAIKG